MKKLPCVIRGMEVTEARVEEIRRFIEGHKWMGRKALSVALSRRWGWRTASGRYNDRGVREVLLKLEAWGYIELPPSRSVHLKGGRVRYDEELGKVYGGGVKLEGRVDEYKRLEVVRVEGEWERKVWNGMMGVYHPQGVPWIVGGVLRYMIYLNGHLVGLSGWGSAAWHVRAREEWIGWSEEERRAHLHHIVSNVRYLILPRVRVKNLASKALREVMKRVAEDWGERYGEVWMYETFVDERRYRGTCYRAAGWVRLGQTKGFRKRGARYERHGRSKAYYIYPGGKDGQACIRRKIRAHFS